MTARPEPVEAYRLCDLPNGTKYRFEDGGSLYTRTPHSAVGRPKVFVYVVEWPQRTYDGIPADAVDVLIGPTWTRDTYTAARDEIRAALAAQEQDQ